MLGPGALREGHGKAFPVAQAGDNAHPASGCDAVPTLLPVLCPPSAQMQTSPTHPALALGVPIPVQEWPQAIGFSKGDLGDTGCWTQLAQQERAGSITGRHKKNTLCSQVSYQARLVFLFTP